MPSTVCPAPDPERSCCGLHGATVGLPPRSPTHTRLESAVHEHRNERGRETTWRTRRATYLPGSRPFIPCVANTATADGGLMRSLCVALGTLPVLLACARPASRV